VALPVDVMGNVLGAAASVAVIAWGLLLVGALPVLDGRLGAGIGNTGVLAGGGGGVL